jgi:hypothetical protein
MFGFRDLGYSQSFVKNMRGIVDAFFGAEPADVELTSDCDDICAPCPYMKGGRCTATDNRYGDVSARDAVVLGRLGLTPGSTHSAPSLVRLVLDRIRPADLPELCADCQWLEEGHCQDGLARGRPADS